MTHDEFLLLLAHELRGPIAAIDAAAQVLRSSECASSTAQEAREVVERQARRMSAALDGLIELGRLIDRTPAARQRVDLVELLGNSERVRLQSRGTHAFIETDAGLLEESLSRLVGQAHAPIDVHIAPAEKGTAGVLTMEPVAGGLVIQFVRVLFEHAGAKVRIEQGPEGRRLVAELPP
jgi:signal transduction histidine kinase